LDRRLQDLDPAGRQVLALIGHSRQPCWQVGNLVEMAMTLGQPDGLRPVFDLLGAGLLYPHLGSTGGRVKSFEQWLAYPPPGGLLVFTLPLVASRAVGEDLGLPDLSKDEGGRMKGEQEQTHASSSFILHPSSLQESDGLEWLLRLSVLWQQVAAAPLRRT